MHIFATPSQSIAGEDDFRYYLDNLVEFKETFACKVSSFCLITNHVHLIIDTGDEPANLGKLMKRIAGRQTRYGNRLEGRTGTLWRGASGRARLTVIVIYSPVAAMWK